MYPDDAFDQKRIRRLLDMRTIGRIEKKNSKEAIRQVNYSIEREDGTAWKNKLQVRVSPKKYGWDPGS